MRYAIVVDGIVVSIAKSDSAIEPNWIPVGDSGAKIGYAYANGEFSEIAQTFEDRKAALIERAKSEKETAFYTNVAIPFPVTEKEIHFRNETDRSNISDKTLQAFINVTGGDSSTVMKFTPVDGTPVEMTSLQLLTAFSDLAATKDALFYAYNAVISDIEAAADNGELDVAEAALDAL